MTSSVADASTNLIAPLPVKGVSLIQEAADEKEHADKEKEDVDVAAEETQKAVKEKERADKEKEDADVTAKEMQDAVKEKERVDKEQEDADVAAEET